MTLSGGTYSTSTGINTTTNKEVTIPWLIPDDPSEIDCLCLGAGRFLRAVLIPIMESLKCNSFILQPRGYDFPNYMSSSERKLKNDFEVDTIEFNGIVKTTYHPIIGYGSLADDKNGKEIMKKILTKCSNLRYIGLGVTEAGITRSSKAMLDVSEFLYFLYQSSCKPKGPISIINTDNVSGNGDKIRDYVTNNMFIMSLTNENEKKDFLEYISEHISFHNTMVDRITSQRENSMGQVPCTEPLPKKALVIEDVHDILGNTFFMDKDKKLLPPGVIIRKEPGDMEKDHALKLRIANGIHTSMVYCMALSRMKDTAYCIGHPLLLPYIDKLYKNDIMVMATELSIEESEIEFVYQDWITRLQHPKFGLSCLFICQNASQKLGIRLMGTICGTITTRGELPSEFMIYAVAVMLKFLTPVEKISEFIFKGIMDDDNDISDDNDIEFEYTKDLKANFGQGWYYFKDSDGRVPQLLMKCRDATFDKLPLIINEVLGMQPLFDESNPLFQQFSAQVCDMYHKLVNGNCLSILEELMNDSGLAINEIESVVLEEVSNVQVIDLHTHLFPSSHGNLMLWGIDELLTYHYLIAEFFETASKALITPEAYFKLTKTEQADLIWDALFIKRSPLSEACKGVLTTIQMLGLHDELKKRDLMAIRAWFVKQDPEQYCEKVFQLAGVKYCVMTNIPFDANEAQHWRPQKKEYSNRFRSALRVDPLLKGDWATVGAALFGAQYETTLEGAKNYIRDWAQTMKPEYLMASTPHDFCFNNDDKEVNGCCEPTVIDTSPQGQDLLEKVLIPIAEELNLPIAMKLGAHRQVNPDLKTGGDGLVTADVGDLRRLCSKFPKVKFLATFLSRVNQHEAAVLANKFPNLHLYGCWWYCNNPSIIKEITEMRIEILGTGFTAQHSDARVLDQILYKWNHSRKVIGRVLVGEYLKIAETGWTISRNEIRRDVERLFGKAYEEFMAKP